VSGQIPTTLSQEELKEIVSKALKSQKEAEYILVLETFYSSNEKDEFTVMYGETIVVQLERKEDDFGTIRAKYAIIPLMLPVIVERVIDRNGETRILYIFTKDGWRGLTVE